jgi:tetratricopeptide (TPR) repeat protein
MEETLGSKIRALRNAKGLTQAELGRGLVTPSMISQIESNRVIPSARLMQALMERLGANPCEFEELLRVNDNIQRYRQARSLLEKEDAAAAKELLLQVIEDLPPQLRADKVYSDLAECYLQLDCPDEAIRMYESALAVALEHDDVSAAVHCFYHLGHIERRRRRLAVAAMYWQRGSELLARHPQLAMPIAVKVEANLGRIYYLLRRQNDALAHYVKACRLAEDFSLTGELAVIHHGLSNVLVEIGEYERAWAHAEQALELYQKSRNTRGVHQCQINLAVILRRQGRAAEASEHLKACLERRALRLDAPRHAKALLELGRNRLLLGAPEEALALAEQAAGIAHRDGELTAEIYQLQAEALFALERCEEAAACLQKAIEIADTLEQPKLRLDLWQWQTRVYHRLRRPEAAIAAQLQAIRLLQKVAPGML